jgi:hypothetical protein
MHGAVSHLARFFANVALAADLWRPQIHASLG